MKQDVKLYIADKLVDFSSELSIPFTYQLKNVNNPTIVKNPFTKTITVIGTQNNNAIFGSIYNLDREQLFDAEKMVGAYFNPSIRTPFSIYRNGELIESGYMQLNSVTLKNKIVNYEITLYGGLGDFFYSLMYNENSELLTLADLTYGVDDVQTGLPFEDSDREFDFTINKEFVYSCFQNVGKDNNNTINDYITFVPSYNGLPENFDSDKVLINTHNNSYISPTTSTTVDNKTYTTYNNYVLAQLPRKYTEWEMLDLRSYLQRPAIKMSKIIDACCNPINNGGYSVQLDPDFFNSNNPYYNDAWVALPLLTNIEKEKNNITTVDGEFINSDLSIGLVDNQRIKEITSYILPISDFSIDGDYIDLSRIPVGTLSNVEINFDILYKCECDDDKLYLTKFIPTPRKPTVGKSVLTTQIVVYNENDEIISETDILRFATDSVNSQLDYILGYFQKVTTNNYKFVTDAGKSSFNIKLENIPYQTKLKIGLKFINNVYSNDKNVFEYGQTNSQNDVIIDGSFVFSPKNIILSRDEPDSVVASNSKISKQFLLKTEKSPADYLLSYCKLFDLHFHKDNGEKTIKIQTRNNFYNGNIIDWNNKIDYSKDFKIKPICFDKKFYQMGLEGESYYLTKYKNEYSVEYGQKRINTNYNFNADTSKIYEGNVYQNAVSAIDTSPYYHTFIDKDDRLLAPFCNSNFEYSLFNVDNTNAIETTELTYTTPAIVGGWSWNRNSGYDSFAKTCFYNLENDEKSLSDISSVLLFYNGQVTPTDFDGNRIRYKLTDDVNEMYTLNNKVPCWLFSDYDYTADYQIITYDCTTLPQFLRYKIVGNQVQASWDFGVPKESYIPNITYEDNTTIYNQYWNTYYNDTLNINTKEVECYVNLNDVNVNSELLHNFYYFNGCYWVLNKIDNYNINKFDSTKCTFIKVNELGNYKNNIGTETNPIDIISEDETTNEEV